jgi:hypothetical protein
MKHALMTTVLVTWSLMTTGAALAQGGMGYGAGSRGGGSAVRNYDPKTVETVTGTVVTVERTSAKGQNKAGGVHLVVKTDQEEIAVHLGPAWYVEKQALKIAAQDTIEVRGSRVSFGGKPAIVAAEVKKGDQVLKLRDDSGAPLWSGQGRRGE